MIFKSLEHQVRGRGHAIIDFEGAIVGEDEVLHLKAFGKDTGISIKLDGISIKLDDTKTRIVIMTKNGMHRQVI